MEDSTGDMRGFQIRKYRLSHCTLYSVQGTVYSVQCTVNSEQCTVYSVQCTVYSIQCTVYSVQYTVYSDTSQLTVYRLKCSVACTICLVKQWFCEIFSCETRTVCSPPVLWVTGAKIEQHLSSYPSLHSVLHH